jgi:hypothetical protein
MESSSLVAIALLADDIFFPRTDVTPGFPVYECLLALRTSEADDSTMYLAHLWVPQIRHT